MAASQLPEKHRSQTSLAPSGASDCQQSPHEQFYAILSVRPETILRATSRFFATHSPAAPCGPLVFVRFAAVGQSDGGFGHLANRLFGHLGFELGDCLRQWHRAQIAIQAIP